MSNNQEVPQNWEQAAQDDYDQLPQKASNLNLNQQYSAGYQQQPQQYYQQQQQQHQPQQYAPQNYNNQYQQYNQYSQYNNQYSNQPGYANNNNNYNTGSRWQQSQPAPASSSLNANAPVFRPNFNAPAFVPRSVEQTRPSPTQTPAPGSAAVLADPKPVKPAARSQAPSATTSTSSSGLKVLKIGGSSDTKKAEPVAEKAKASEPTTEAAKPKPEPKQPAAKSSEPSAAKIDPKAIEIVDDSDKIDNAVVEDLFGKEHLSIIFMGHVDAGKSTMGGNLLFLTGTVDKRTMEKYEKEAKDAGRESWYLSWVLDLTAEERSKGKTVEVGRGFFETERRRYTILDAPGHKTYVPSMIGGASQADVGILVISARKGEYETGFERGGQTREHAVLAKNQGVNKLIIAVNKMDDPTVNWSKERYDECTGKLALYLRSLGYKPKEDVIFMPVSAYSGAGLKDRVPTDVCPWYDGPSLLEYLDNLTLAERNVNAPFMMPIGSKYRDLGTVVEGKLESGHAKKGSQLVLMPNKVPVEVVTIYNETEQETNLAACGEQVKLRLKGVEEEDVQIGFVLSSIDHPVHTVTAFEAQIAIIELKSILSAGFTCVIHVHTAIEEVTFAALLHKLEKGTNRKSRKPPAFATRGMKIIARLEVVSTTGFCIERFEDYPQLGRFTLRDQGNTIAIGKVTKLLN
ncbi:P-loop containing nucleoside triphosphate hydrolase protein [Lipomyces japonicus]|uniref:P-loop containing nucleoside triphosphate hydrolase protein n=1 Tax=Lipomyces japonicus TaxID=56871 RepID=UPI0034CD74FB